jgi:phage shock protein E
MKKKASVFTLVLFLGASHPDFTAGVIFAQSTAQTLVANAKTVDSKGAKTILDKQPGIIVLDVRTPQEYAGGHLKNARNLDYNAPDFATQLAKLDKKKSYLVYCAVGGRSSKAAKLMQEQGFRQVFNVSEGYTGLKKVGLAVAE